MKLLSSLSLLPLGLATQSTETIPYQLQSAAETLLNLYVDTSFTTELLKHGCWCAKLNKNSNLSVLGGNNPVDELDQLCKDWAKTRRCGRNPSENCEFFGKTDNYQVSSGDTGYSTGTLLCPDSDACLKETCEVDVWFLNGIEGFRLANSGFVADETPVCTLPVGGRPGNPIGNNNCPFLRTMVDYDSLISCATGYEMNSGACGLIPPCDASPCENGGTCTNSADLSSYTCACASGFTGVNCEVGIPCSLVPCQNGGSCTNSADFSTYTCACASGFTGTDCETPVPCSANPCQNGGSCTNSADFSTHTCACASGFTGTDCETPAPCSANPCQNGGSCTNSGDLSTHTCACSSGFTGTNCENAASPCNAIPCQNGGTCTDSADSSTYTCACTSDYSGPTCEINNAAAAQVQDALAAAGVDNSLKQIAVTLVWDVTCDLDLHVFEPSGTEIWYSNQGPTADSGTQDTDAQSLGANGLAVENTSWDTGPAGTYRISVKNYGGCSPEVDYKLYVSIDGVMTVYERTAPAGDETKIEVATFTWSP